MQNSKNNRNNNHSRILVGTCGWSYEEDWKGIFYPNFVKPAEYLEYYCQILPTVEIDSSFYHTPRKNVVENWGKRTPSYFSFSAKLPQAVTHDAKLNLKKHKATLPAINQYLDNFSPLEIQGKMIGHLIQLPPSFSFDKNWDDLENFLNFWADFRETQGKKILKDKYSSQSWRSIIEFRNKSWMRERTFALLRAYHVTYCSVIEPELPPRMDITTNDLSYMRFHGFGKKPWWNYNFSKEELEQWAAELLNSMEKNPKTKHVAYFNNHFSGNAVKNAMEILPMLKTTPMHEIDFVNSRFQKSSVKKSRKIQEKKELANNKSKIDNKKSKSSLDSWMKK
ncbi:MAG: DUF72 domain-containing protein [Promethearchaeota archaeon]